jgi:putative endonuclease
MFYVYLLASGKYGTLYAGVTNDLIRRIYEHRTKAVPGFTSRYNVTRLVWYENHDNATSAISREKDIKKWRRDWKIRLIEEDNPDWSDLYSSITR